MKKIGFIILSHANPQQTIRLARRIQTMYDNPPIVCHHDFGQSPISLNDFPRDVKIATPYISTGWGKYSIISAVIKSLEILHRDFSPEWFFVLSGSDYPTLAADKVLADLSLSGMDAYLDFREVRDRHPLTVDSLAENPTLRHFDDPSNLALAWRRYRGAIAWLPTLRPGPRIGRHTFYLPFKDPRSPFCETFKCYYGDHWFAGNRRVAAVLVNPTDQHMHLRRHLRWRIVPEECYYHSILANDPQIKITRTTKRYAEWLGGGSHPQNLQMNDLPALLSSGSHFARKFAEDSPLLDELDRMI
jgi:Core-2/I-Branching enzyme